MGRTAILNLLFLAFIYFASSCDQKKLSPKKTPGLFGTWELSYSIKGGYGYQYDPYVHYKLSNGCIFQFNKDSIYKHYENWTLVSKGKFHISHIKKSDLDVISFDNNSMPSIIQLNDKGLYLGIIEPDAGGDIYEKISN